MERLNVDYSNKGSINAHDELAVEILLALYDSEREGERFHFYAVVLRRSVVDGDLNKDEIRKELSQLLTHLQLSQEDMDRRTMMKLSILSEHLQTVSTSSRP